MLSATIRASKRHAEVHVGPWDLDRNDHRFGWDSELTIRDDRWMGEHRVTVEVGSASIGSLPAKDALERSKSYVAAGEIGATIQAFIENLGWGFDQVVDLLSDSQWLGIFGVGIQSIVDYREEEDAS